MNFLTDSHLNFQTIFQKDIISKPNTQSETFTNFGYGLRISIRKPELWIFKKIFDNFKNFNKKKLFLTDFKLFSTIKNDFNKPL